MKRNAAATISLNLDEIWGSQGDYHHVALEVLGSGDVLIYTPMLASTCKATRR
jgi:hypothetical protein